MNRRALAVSLAFLFVVAYWSLRLFDAWTEGGNNWQQGDWLIHCHSGLVRRGLFGSLILELSDLSGLRPLLLTLLLQALFSLGALLLLATHVLRVGLNELTLLALSCPAFFVLFWINQPKAGFRKEVVVFAAFACLLPAARSCRARLWTWTSLVVFALACFAHEANTLLLPFYLLGLYLVRPPESRAWSGTHWVALLIAGLGTLFALVFSQAADPTSMGRPLLERGESEYLCTGAIEYLRHDLSYALADVGTLLVEETPWSFPLCVMLGLTPVLLLLKQLGVARGWLVAAAGSFLVFLPLYLLGIDWGRWLSFQVSALTFLALILIAKAHEPPAVPSSWRRGMYVLWALAFLWGMEHIMGHMRGGLTTRVVLDVYNQLRG